MFFAEQIVDDGIDSERAVVASAATALQHLRVLSMRGGSMHFIITLLQQP